uniref:mRNA (guanine-N(7))-methyltransferase n=1 Tax=Neobodo designis TaxID=312471 RepID=A0A7S1Q8U2_NEODS
MQPANVAASYDRITSQHDGAAANAKLLDAQRGAVAGKVDDEAQLPFRHFNNFVKKRLINEALEHFTKHALAKTPERSKDGPAQLAVLDLASGRGGDLQKWLFANRVGKMAGTHPVVADVWGFDISPNCVAAANARAEDIVSSAAKGPQRLQLGAARFEVADCFAPGFWDMVASRRRRGDNDGDIPAAFDLCASFFALHYSCGTQERLTATINGVAAALRPGGLFIGTIVDANELAKRLVTEPATVPAPASESAEGRPQGKLAMPPSLSNALFQVTVLTDEATALVEKARETWAATATDEDKDLLRRGKKPAPALPLGLPYYFHLGGHVDSDEFAVPFDALTAACDAAGLTLVDTGDVARPQYLRMVDWFGDRAKIKALGNDADLSEDERRLVSLYRTFCFEKRAV